jgi:hypothetical protein
MSVSNKLYYSYFGSIELIAEDKFINTLDGFSYYL